MQVGQLAHLPVSHPGAVRPVQVESHGAPLPRTQRHCCSARAPAPAPALTPGTRTAAAAAAAGATATAAAAATGVAAAPQRLQGPLVPAVELTHRHAV